MRKLQLLLAVALALALTAWGMACAESEKKPTMIELMQMLSGAVQDMNARDRAGDTPIYQIDAERFVSEQDIEALLGVLEVRKALQQAQKMDEHIIEPDADFAESFLVSEMLLRAEADALGMEDLDKSVKWYMKDGWLLSEPETPDASDTEALIRQGWIRLQLTRMSLMSAQNMETPYEASAGRINELVESLKLKYPSIQSGR